MSKVVPFIPIWNRPPNKFVRYQERPFHTNARGNYRGDHGVETVAHFIDKKGNPQEMTAYVKWTPDVWNMETRRWVKLRSWMRWCPDFVTRHVSDEMWETIIDSEKMDPNKSTRKEVLKNIWGII